MAKRSKFSLSNYKLLSLDSGELVPCGLLEVLPGDSIQHATSALVRASALLAPVMHPVHVKIHHWFVPHRLVWEDFEDFITGGPDGEDASVFPTITFPNGGPEIGTLADYLGIPCDIVNAAGTEVSALPFRGYQLIWNEWYRDQDLETAAVIALTSGPDTTTSLTLKNAAWEKDYFTSARPWENKGPDITIGVGGDAPVKGLAFQGTIGGTISAKNNIRETGGDGTEDYTFGQTIDNLTTNLVVRTTTDVEASAFPNIVADLSQAGAISINELREALALQRFQEARARYGSRYVEYLRYLGVRSSDARLQRPEYLGGGKQTIQFSEVLQTGVTTSGNSLGVGELRGHGISAMRSNRYRRFFEEHGYVFSFICLKPRTMYFQGVPRTWNRRTKEDFWQNELQFIGQQEVLNKEIYASHTTPAGVFGYQDRYDEYRRQESSVGGEFRGSGLNFWHFAREFGSDPTLNSTFVSCVPTERTFAVSSKDVWYVMAHHSIQARRLVTPVGISKTF